MRLFAILFIFLPFIAHTQTGRLETVVQKGHSAAVKAVAVSNDGKYLVTGIRDRTAKIWDVVTGAEIRTFSGHEHTVNGVQFSPDGKYIATSSADNSVKVWNVLTGKEIFSSPRSEKYMTDVAFSPDGKYVLAAGYGDSASLYELPSGKLINQLAVNADQGSGYGINIDFSADGQWLAIGEDNKTVNVYRIADWKLVYTFKPAEGWCGGCGTLVSFSPDSKSLLKLSHNDKARQYDLASGKQLAEYGNEADKIQGIAFSNDAKKIMVSFDDTIRQWDPLTKKLLITIPLDSVGGISEVIYNHDASALIIAGDKNIAIAFDASKGKALTYYTGVLNSQDKGGLNYNADNYWESYIARYVRLKNLLLLTADDKRFITGKSGTNAVAWNIASGAPEQIFPGHKKAVICFDLSVDGKYLVTADGSGEAFLWDMITTKKIKSFKGHREPIFEVRFSPDGKSIATSSWDAAVIVWDVTSGEQLSYMDMDGNSAYSMSFTPDGLYIVTGKFDKLLELREPDSKKVVRTFIGHTDVVSSISFGPDKYKMLTSSWDGTARIWDISTGMMLQKFKTKYPLHTAVYSADGKKVITAGDDRLIRIWDAVSGALLKTLEGHQSEITSVKMSKDGKLLLSYSLDGAIKCWNLEKGIEFYEHIHIGENEWMARTKEGYFNATAGARASIHFVKDMQVFEVEQFFEEYYRPDLLMKIFTSRGVPTEQIQGIEQTLNQSPPPTLKIFSSMRNAGKDAEIFIKILDEGGGVDEIRLTHNGKIIPVNKDSLKFPSGKGLSTVYKQTCVLIAGNNTFSVSGFSKGRVESISVQTDIYSEQADPATVCHVFAIGIDKYKNTMMTLNYAREDAEAFVKAIENKGDQLFQKVIIHTLYDEQATRKNILDTLESLSHHIASHDVFILYYAGHGSMSENHFYFIPSECPRLYDPTGLPTTAIDATDVQEKLTNIKALKQIIIMDACQSGGSVELLSMRGGTEEKAIAQLSRSAGIHVLASAGGDQNAKEIGELKHGLFTYVLLEALSGKADGAPNDGKITIYELKSYLDDQVPELNRQYNGNIQYPYTFSRGHDFPVVIE